MKLYNDLKFRQKADELAPTLAKAATDKSSKECKELLARYESYVKNITNDALKPTT